MSSENTNQWFDLTGMLPPLPLEACQKILGPQFGSGSAKHTYQPLLVSENQFNSEILPKLQLCLEPELVKFITSRVNQTFRIRKTLKQIGPEISAIVGDGNFSALWLDREAFSSDSMEHRALVTEAVIHVYSAEALGQIVTLLYRHEIPMIPYGEGGGYSMGVTPMAPAVTLSVRGIDHITPIKPSRRNPKKFEVTVGAGVPFEDLQKYLAKRGYILRCNPNTPRSATGGIVATGSNGGRKIFEVVLEGRAVTGKGSAVRFALDEAEERTIQTEPFLMANKFFSISSNQTGTFMANAKRVLARHVESQISLESRELSIPLIGAKAAVNMQAQRMESLSRSGSPLRRDRDPLGSEPALPISAFVGAEGCTGVIYEVTLEIEKPEPWISGARLHFTDVAKAMDVTRKIKERPQDDQPVFFEIITGASIRRFLIQDFPHVFSESDEAVLFVGIEGSSQDDANFRREKLLAHAGLNKANESWACAGGLRSIYETAPEWQSSGRPSFEEMIRPRERLPKKLRTKCKTDMEIRTEYLADVLKLVTGTPSPQGYQKDDVMFGHLTPSKTAIIHWNIGGFDLYREESAHAAWDYLESILSKAQTLAPVGDSKPSASFSGEHGIAGKAAFLWLNHLPVEEFNRMCLVKDALDPKGLFNPETLFLRSSVARSLRARLIAFGSKQLLSIADQLARSNTSVQTMQGHPGALEKEKALAFATSEALRCTRCNSCKICPVIDAEHELRRENPRAYRNSVLPSKRNLVMFLEWVAALSKTATPTAFAARDPIRDMFRESAKLLSKCFYCRKCDKACPVDINIHPMVEAFQSIGGVAKRSNLLFKFLYDRLMGEDRFKDTTYRVMGILIKAGLPVLALLRRAQFLPDWIKTYFSPPAFAAKAYEAAEAGTRLSQEDNFLVISPRTGGAVGEFVRTKNSNTLDVFIRYRGCMDTYSNPAASETVDRFFKQVLGVEFVDLEKKMCCGFPFEADGLKQRAERARFLSLVEIYKCAAKLLDRHAQLALRASDLDPSRVPELRFTVFSNCPTCVEAIKEMQTMLADPATCQRLRVAAKLPSDFSFQDSRSAFAVKDTAEIAVTLLEDLRLATEENRVLIENKGLQAILPVPSKKPVGLKVPCHNTALATTAQVKLLRFYYDNVSSYDRCCGLSGTARFKHPKIGTKIAEKLFEQIREARPATVVSGCPSCRDGVTIQRNILKGRQDPVGEFNVAGIFEQIVADHSIRP